MQKGANGEAVLDEEQRMRRLEKKELDKIAKRFRVITPAEFERNLQLQREISGGDEARNGNSGNMSDVVGETIEKNATRPD